MTEQQWQTTTCVPKPTGQPSTETPGYVLPKAPRLSAARFDGPCVSHHVHQYFEIVYVESGAGMHGIGTQLAPAQAGDIFLIAPGEVHNTSKMTGACKWVVAFGADALNPTHTDAVAFAHPADMILLLAFFRQRDIETSHFHLPVASRQRWVNLLEQLERELGLQHIGYQDVARALLVLLLTDIARMAFADDASFVLPSRLLLVRVFRFIEAHFRDSISLRDVATAVDYAPAYLTDLVRKATGRTVLEWIVERRMAEARYLLRETDYTMQQIAESIGYRHVGHFGAQFKRLHGLTPHAWRSA